ncbi:MAG TPA: class I SAM-dependent methyltransferase [Verrucomicrobiae bacterium]
MSSRPNEFALTNNFEFEALKQAENYRKRLLIEFGPHLQGDVIEVGAGIGQITTMVKALPAVKSVLGIEPDPDFCAMFKATVPDIPLIRGTVSALNEGSQWDGVVCINVLEHIQDDVDELKRYAKLLSQRNGRLCLFVPARPEIYAPIDKDFGHFRRYKKHELQQKLTEAGFDIIRLQYFNVTGYFAWWLNFCVLKKRQFEVGSVRMFDRIIFPVTSTVESWLPAPPFGQSLLAVAEAK